MQCDDGDQIPIELYAMDITITFGNKTCQKFEFTLKLLSVSKISFIISRKSQKKKKKFEWVYAVIILLDLYQIKPFF